MTSCAFPWEEQENQERKEESPCQQEDQELLKVTEPSYLQVVWDRLVGAFRMQVVEVEVEVLDRTRREEAEVDCQLVEAEVVPGLVVAHYRTIR